MANAKTSNKNTVASKINEYRWRIFKRGKLVLNGCMTLAFSFAISAAMPGYSSAADAVGVNTLPTGRTPGITGATNSVTGNVMDINMYAPVALESWGTFSIGRNAAVNINGGSGATYIGNVRTGGGVSYIYGALNAPGVNVFLNNSAGVTFNGSASVNVGSLMATTANSVGVNFGTGNITFGSASGASIVNKGDITVSDGGFAILAAPNVLNGANATINASITALVSADTVAYNYKQHTLTATSSDDGSVINRGTINGGTDGITLLVGVNPINSGEINSQDVIVASARNASVDFDDNSFSATNAGEGRAANTGDITVGEGGKVVVAGPVAVNTGTITADKGRIELASTGGMALDLRGDGLISFEVSKGTQAKIGVTNTGTLQARSGVINISADLASDVIDGVVNLSGIVDADSFDTTSDGGAILVSSVGNINAGTDTANSLNIKAGNGSVTIDAAKNVDVKNTSITANGQATKDGGTISISGDAVQLTDVAVAANGGAGGAGQNGGNGGTVTIAADTHLQADGLDADAKGGAGGAGGVGGNGGVVALLASGPKSIVLSHASIDVSGASFGGNGGDAAIDSDGNVTLFDVDVKADGGINGDGGTINVQSDATLAAAKVSLSANGRGVGNGGDITIGSEGDIFLAGVNVDAQAGLLSGNGGTIDVDAGGIFGSLGGSLNANAKFNGNGGEVTVNAVDSAVLLGTDINVNGGIFGGNAGSIALESGKTLAVLGSDLQANGILNGNGGTVTLLAGDSAILGATSSISARGGYFSGNGGLIEIAGEHVRFLGDVDVSAPAGEAGTLHITSSKLIIRNGSTGGDNLDVIYEDKFEGVAATGANIILTARDSIEMEDLADNELQGSTGNLTFESSVDAGGSIFFDDLADGVTTSEGDIAMTAGNGGINIGYLTTGGEGVSNPGSMYLATALSGEDLAGNGDISATDLTVTGFAYNNEGSADISGNITVDAAGDVQLDSANINVGINANGGSATALADIDANGDIDIINGTSIVAYGTVNGNEVKLAVNSELDLDAGGNVTTGGTLLVSANAGADEGAYLVASADAKAKINAGGNVTLADVTVDADSNVTADTYANADADAKLVVNAGTDEGTGDVHITGATSVTADANGTSTSVDANADAKEYLNGDNVTVDGASDVVATAIGLGAEGAEVSADSVFDIDAIAGSINVAGDINSTASATVNELGDGDTHANANVDLNATDDINLGKVKADADASTTATGYANADANAKFVANAGNDGTGDLHIAGNTDVTADATSTGDADTDARVYLNANGDVNLDGVSKVLATATGDSRRHTTTANAVFDVDAYGYGDIVAGNIVTKAAATNTRGDADADAKVDLNSDDADLANVTVRADADAADDADANAKFVANAGQYYGGYLHIAGDTNVKAIANGADDADADARVYLNSNGDVNLDGTSTVLATANGDSRRHTTTANAVFDVDAMGYGDIVAGDIKAKATSTNTNGDADADAKVDLNSDDADLANVTVRAKADAADDADANAKFVANTGAYNGGYLHIAGDTNVKAIANGADDADADARVYLNANGDVNLDGKSIVLALADGMGNYENTISANATFDVDANWDGAINAGDIKVKAYADANANEGNSGYASADAKADLNAGSDITLANVKVKADADTHEGYYGNADASAKLVANAGNSESGGDLHIAGDTNVKAIADDTDDADADARVYLNANGDVNLDGTSTVLATANGFGSYEYGITANAVFDVDAYGNGDINAGDITVGAYADAASSEGYNTADTSAKVSLNAANDINLTNVNVTSDANGEDDAEADAKLIANAGNSEAGGNLHISGNTDVSATAESNGYSAGANADARTYLNANGNIDLDGTSDVHAVALGMGNVEGSSIDANAVFDVDATNGGDINAGDIDVSSSATAGGEYSGAANADAKVKLDADGNITLANVAVNADAESTTDASSDAQLLINVPNEEESSEGDGNVTINGAVDVSAGSNAGNSAYANANAEVFADGDVTVNDVDVTSDANATYYSEASSNLTLVAGNPSVVYSGDLQDIGVDSAETSSLPVGDGSDTSSVRVNGNINVDANAVATFVNEGGEGEEQSYGEAYATSTTFLGAPNNVSVEGDITVNADADATDYNEALAVLVVRAGEDTGADASLLADGDGTAYFAGDIRVTANTNTDAEGEAVAVGVVVAENDIVFNYTAAAPVVSANDSFLQQFFSGDDFGSQGRSHLRLIAGDQIIVLEEPVEPEPTPEPTPEIASTPTDEDIFNVNTGSLVEEENNGNGLVGGLEPAAGGEDECDYMNCELPS